MSSVDIPAELEREVAWLIEKSAREKAFKALYERACADDAAFAEYCEVAGWTKGSLKLPIVRASAYRRIDRKQELPRNDRHPGRPVILRGALTFCWGGEKYANHWCIEVIQRYLRRSKYTCLDEQQVWRDVESIYHKASIFERPAGVVSDFFHNQIWNRFSKSKWVAGRRVRLTEHQINYLWRLKRIADKARKLEETQAAFTARVSRPSSRSACIGNEAALARPAPR